jgi:hypothetical protein
MKPTASETTVSGRLSGRKEFKTMEIQAKPFLSNAMNDPLAFNSVYYSPIYNQIVMMVMSFWQNESNKKFYKNNVLSIEMAQLPSYSSQSLIKSSFKSCATVNNAALSFKMLNKAEFFVLRSTCDDDIHKAIKYGIWTSTNYTNHILNNRFRECSKSNVPLFLIFT